MANVTLQEVETLMNELTAADRRRLIERALSGLRTVEPAEDWDAQLAAMAADPYIQRELAAIN